MNQFFLLPSAAVIIVEQCIRIFVRGLTNVTSNPPYKIEAITPSPPLSSAPVIFSFLPCLNSSMQVYIFQILLLFLACTVLYVQVIYFDCVTQSLRQADVVVPIGIYRLA